MRYAYHLMLSVCLWVGCLLTLLASVSGVGVQTVCGDGIRSSAEQCDDGNSIDGDGCSRHCRVEPYSNCSQGNPSVCNISPPWEFRFNWRVATPSTATWLDIRVASESATRELGLARSQDTVSSSVSSHTSSSGVLQVKIHLDYRGCREIVTKYIQLRQTKLLAVQVCFLKHDCADSANLLSDRS